MADIIDAASDIEEYARSTQIALCEREAAKPIPTSDVCLNCGEATINGARWCSQECCSDWQKENR